MSAKYSRRQRGTGGALHDRIFWVRDMLNIIFMIGAVVGVIFYFFTQKETLGIIIILTAMFFKMAEYSIHIFHKWLDFHYPCSFYYHP